MKIEIDVAHLLDKKHHGAKPAEVLALSPAALKGVTDKDAELLAAAFGIRTIGDMARNKYFVMAQTLRDLVEMAE
jgi:hypothetical protein